MACKTNPFRFIIELMNKAIKKYFSKLGKKGGKKSWEVRKKKLLQKSKKVGDEKRNNKAKFVSKSVESGLPKPNGTAKKPITLIAEN